LGNGANALRDAIGMVSPYACFRQNGVDTEPGFIASVRDAMNVRFDIYNASMSSVKNNANFRPARNVRKGYLASGGGGGAACNAALAEDPNQAMGLPRDNCFGTDTCPYMEGRMGDGTWDFDKYWTFNHTTATGERTRPTVDGAAASNANLPSRYDVYRYEIDQGFVGDQSGQAATPPPANPEVGGPTCSSSTTSDTPDRRIFYAAIVNCQANLPPALPLGPGSQSGVPVAAFAKFFVTQPVEGSQDEIMAEIVELVTPGGVGGHNFDEVQLYR
jgi:hypothetical protein